MVLFLTYIAFFSVIGYKYFYKAGKLHMSLLHKIDEYDLRIRYLNNQMKAKNMIDMKEYQKFSSEIKVNKKIVCIPLRIYKKYYSDVIYKEESEKYLGLFVEIKQLIKKGFLWLIILTIGFIFLGLLG